MKTELQRHGPKMQGIIMVNTSISSSKNTGCCNMLFRECVLFMANHRPPQGLLFKGPLFGAYSELFAALSPKVTAKHNGGFIIPWGRIGDLPGHIEEGLKSKKEGGTGAAAKFWSWCEQETETYL